MALTLMDILYLDYTKLVLHRALNLYFKILFYIIFIIIKTVYIDELLRDKKGLFIKPFLL